MFTFAENDIKLEMGEQHNFVFDKMLMK